MSVKITACSEPWFDWTFENGKGFYLVLFFITVKFVRVLLVLVSPRLAFNRLKLFSFIPVLLHKFFIL